MPSPLTELAVAALAVQPLARACRLAAWTGDGRELTTTGVLRPAVAVEACRELGIELPPGTRTLRSAKDVDELQQAWEVAVAADLVLITANRVRATAAAAEFAAAAAAAGETGAAGRMTPEFAERVVSAWIRGAGVPLGVPGEPCSECLTVLWELSLSGKPTEMTRLAEAAVASARGPRLPGSMEAEDDVCPGCGEVHAPELPGMLGAVIEDMEEDMAAHAMTAVAFLVHFGAATTGPGKAPGGTAVLTPLGRMLAEWVMAALAPDPAIGAAEMAEQVASLPQGLAGAAAAPWFAARTPDGAVRELLGCAEHAGPGLREVALELARERGGEGRAAWREFAKKPGFGAYARQWLTAQGASVRADERDEAWLLVDLIMQASATAPLPVVSAVFAGAMLQAPGTEADDVIAAILDSGHPAARDVAELLSPTAGAVGGLPGALLAGSAGGSPFGLFGGLDDDDDLDGYGNDVPEGTLYQVKITLNGVSKPPVWRRLLVPAAMTLDELHEALQAAMGWDDAHMHVFSDGVTEFGVPDADLGHADEGDFELADLISVAGERITYTYDLGDDWVHAIKLEKVFPPGTPDAARPAPQCLAGKGACPPEDCGGPWGYANLKDALADPGHEDHGGLMDWLGLSDPAGFDPARFSPDEVNARLRHLHTAATG